MNRKFTEQEHTQLFHYLLESYVAMCRADTFIFARLGKSDEARKLADKILCLLADCRKICEEDIENVEDVYHYVKGFKPDTH